MTKGLFSVVIASYGVVHYLDTFLNSLVRQSFPFEDLDIIIVDDASIDGSYAKAREWEAKFPQTIRVVTKSNGGPASARNVGLGMAKNEWVTFCDPDDALQEAYFENVASFIARDEKLRASILTTRVMVWQEKTGKISDTHPLARKYFFGERLVDLDKDPHNIQLGGATIFLRKSVIDEHDLRFDERIRPTFEDGEFIGRFMSHLERPVVGFVSNARYLYRKRGDGSSLVQSGWGQAERYDEVLRFGYIGLLDGLRNRLGHVPVWAQNMVLYDIQWYLSEDKKMNSSTAWLSDEQRTLLLELLRKTFTYIDRQTIDMYNVTPWSWLTRDAILARFKGQGAKVKRVYLWSEKNTSPTRIVYTYSGVLPEERFMVDGEPVRPIRSKSVEHRYYGESFVFERTVWLPTSKQPQVWLNQEFVPFESLKRAGWAKPTTTADLKLAPKSTPVSPRLFGALGTRITSSDRPLGRRLQQASMIRAKLDNRIAIDRLVFGGSTLNAATNVGRRVVARQIAALQLERQRKNDQTTIAWANSPSNKHKYRDAWVIMDRVDKADDNGEHLYRYIAAQHPEINVWFLLSRSSKDWGRLAAEGFRLVDYGSQESVALSLAAEFQISSDATHSVQYPIDQKRYGKLSSRFVFLQHGVIKDDLSRWLNPKDLAMFVTSTKAEYDSIAGDNTPYKFTSKETKLTGLPRFDSLIRKSEELTNSDKNLIVIMPTWRQGLRDDLRDAESNYQRKLILESSEFGSNWLSILKSERLHDLAATTGAEIVFIPHPAMAEIVDLLDVPEAVQIFDANRMTMQTVIARSRLLLTDYSSIAFDAALVGSAVIYFQFDAAEIFSGKHSYRKGYFDYERDGFGPIATGFQSVMDLFLEFEGNKCRRTPDFEMRAVKTFEYVDRNSCAKVYEEICKLS